MTIEELRDQIFARLEVLERDVALLKQGGIILEETVEAHERNWQSLHDFFSGRKIAPPKA